MGDLAESWTVAPDGLTYTFKLRKGVKFHDGTALTSADIKATYDRLRNPPQGVRLDPQGDATATSPRSKRRTRSRWCSS